MSARLPPVPHVPQRMVVGGQTLRLVGMAEEVADRFLAEFPDDGERYGVRGHEWCIHDNHYVLAWAASDVQAELAGDENGDGVLERQLGWLSGVLAARAYPLERLARDLEIAADVARERSGAVGPAIAQRLLAGAELVRARSLGQAT